MDTVAIKNANQAASASQPPATRPAPATPPAPAAAESLKKGDKLDLSEDIKLNDYSADLKTKRDEFIGYRQMWATSGGENANVYGVQYGRGTDLKEYGPVRLGYVWSGTLGASGNSMHVGGDIGGKAFLGMEKQTQHFLPGMPVPVGIYVAAGPSLNASNFNGNTAVGAGVYGAVGLDLFGFNVEVRQDLSTNYRSLGFRGGFQIRF